LASFRTTKAGIKLHTQLDIKTGIPEFILFTNASVHDVNALDFVSFELNSFYIMDRGYVDYKRLYKTHQCDAFFVTRAKDNMDYRRLYPHKKDVGAGILADQSVMLNGFYVSKYYPIKLPRIKFYDAESKKILIFLTNDFITDAIKITLLYKSRWQIELFF